MKEPHDDAPLLLKHMRLLSLKSPHTKQTSWRNIIFAIRPSGTHNTVSRYATDDRPLGPRNPEQRMSCNTKSQTIRVLFWEILLLPITLAIIGRLRKCQETFFHAAAQGRTHASHGIPLDSRIIKTLEVFVAAWTIWPLVAFYL